MRIAVNTRLLLKDKLEGIGWFSYESLKRIVSAHPEHEFIFIFDRKYDADFIFADNIIPVVAGPPARHPVLWSFWLECVIPRVLKKHGADLFISPDGFLSLRSNVPSLSVIHDINFEHHPEQLPWMVRKFYRWHFPRAAKKACRVGTVSEYSKQDIASVYHINTDKVDVYYNGANSLYQPASPGKIASVRNEISNGAPYFIFVGALNPRKNIPGLLKAFDKFKMKDQKRVKLVIVGDTMHQTRLIKEAIEEMQHNTDVIFTGRMPVEKLSGVMGAARALIFMPFFEGFGIPVLEAMNAEIPIVCSNRTSLPEVVGDAALMADPENTGEIASAMQKITEDDNLCQELVDRGREQRKKFSWDKTAEKFWSSIEKCLNEIEQ
ncbi:MAG: glycosyltransferase family 1 protein [Candidatus Delongbacteria bacterium]|jgi:glycosyltransferase involved in cell wall biosynthesis|nr:glycosyltransferase family 1 protein [Candidatus Delongbacteria bacterium]